METTADLQLRIDRFRRGDTAAMEQLIDRAYSRLARLAHKMLQDFPRIQHQEETSDLLHTVYPRLKKTLESTEFSSVQSFFRLAGAVMRRQLIDWHRRHFGPEGSGANRAADASSQAQAERINRSDGTHEPTRLAAWAEFHARVEQLPDDEREVVDLLWYQELSQQEAADLLGVSVRTIKRRWLAARLKLQAVIQFVES